MRILFDHGTPAGIARFLAEHQVTEAIAHGRDRISNGELLAKAEAAGFELLLTTDKKNPLPTECDRPENIYCGAGQFGMAHGEEAS